MKALFLVESGHGMGHIVRCLNLAKELKKFKISSIFLTRGKEGIEKIRFPKKILSRNISPIDFQQVFKKIYPDFLILDILDPNFRFINSLNLNNVFKVVIFDFIFSKPISADLIVNPNLNMLNYKSTKAKCLLGPRYAILGKYFKGRKIKIKKNVKNVMVSMGGSDPRNYTELAIQTLRYFNFKVSVVIGHLAKNKIRIKRIIKKLNNFKLFYDISQKKMAELMRKNDLLLSTAGNTMYEASSVGLPNIVFCNHQKHFEIANAFEKRGAVYNLGINPDINQIKKAVLIITKDYKKRVKMSSKAKRLVDGKGVERVAKAIIKYYYKKYESTGNRSTF